MFTRIRQQQERLRALRALLARDEGWAGTAMLFMATLLLLLIGFQTAWWFAGYNVAQTAAQAAYTDSRAYQAPADAGKSTAEQLVANTRQTLRNPRVTIIRGADTVTVTITGNAVALLPGIEAPPISYTMTGPIEKWVPAP